MNKNERRRIDIEGKFILHLRMQGIDPPIRAIREMAGRHRTLARLSAYGVTTISKLCSLKDEELENIIGSKKADLIIHLLGLYGLKDAPGRVITADVTTTEVTH